MSQDEFYTKVHEDYKKFKNLSIWIISALAVMVLTLALGWVVRMENHGNRLDAHERRFEMFEYRQQIIQYNYIDRQTIELLVASFDAYTKELIAIDNDDSEEKKKARQRYNELWELMLKTTSYQTRGGSR